MKVLMTADAVGGVWTYAIELASALEAFDVEVVLATMGAAPTSRQRQEARWCANLTLEPGAFRLEWMRDPWTDVDRAADWLLELEARHAPDVVHLNGYAHGSLPWRSPVIVAGHSCVRSWWTSVHGAPPPAGDWDEYTRRVTAGLQAADLVVAPTGAMLDFLRQHYGELPRASVVMNGRSAHRFTPGLKEPLILSAGRLWDEAKNVAMLARVADTLSWPVYVAGSTASPDGGVVHLSSRVRCLGPLAAAELSAWMARATIFALPARYEPFGLAALEAALCGCALVLGDIATLHEVWGDAALYVRPDDDDALVEALELLAGDRVRLRAMSRAARARALELSPQRMAVQYVALYDRLLEARVAGREVACAS